MLKKTIFIATTVVLLAISGHINASNVNIQAQAPQISQEDMKTDAPLIYKEISPLKLVAQPDKYMNKKIRFHAVFDKFSAIGLDYPPVKRDSKEYLSFLIKRENVTNYNIPLSELKLILKRDFAEKELVNLETGDEIEVYGVVVSSALGDPWVDVERVTILTQTKDNNEKDNKDNTINNEGK